jgi:hypothetical protein
MDFAFFKNRLDTAGVVFAAGLSEAEIQQIEEVFRFQFPPDLREFLAFALPVSDGWMNWRDCSREEIEDRLRWSYEGICFDIEHNEFWLEEWGEKPESLEAGFAIAKAAVEKAPTLIPVYGHRFIPDRPNLAGNPVFSVWQTDIIYYGTNLPNYIRNEYSYHFRGITNHRLEEEIRFIEFWSNLLEKLV